MVSATPLSVGIVVSPSGRIGVRDRRSRSQPSRALGCVRVGVYGRGVPLREGDEAVILGARVLCQAGESAKLPRSGEAAHVGALVPCRGQSGSLAEVRRSCACRGVGALQGAEWVARRGPAKLRIPGRGCPAGGRVGHSPRSGEAADPGAWVLCRGHRRQYPAPGVVAPRMRVPSRSTFARYGPLLRLVPVFVGLVIAFAVTSVFARSRPWQLRAHTTPKIVRAGTTTTVEITLQNLAKVPISADLGDRLAYHWLDASGEVVHYDGRRTVFADQIAPGESVQIEATLLTPAEPGSYLLQWEPVREGVGWFGPPRRSPDILIPVEVVGGRPQWKLLSSEGEDPLSLRANQEILVNLRLRNEGPEDWDPALGDRLSYHWRSASGELVIRDGLRTELAAKVAVGQEIELQAKLRAPPQAGRYLLEWEPLREGVRWRGDPSPPRSVLVKNSAVAWAPVGGLAPDDLHAGEQVSVELTIANLGEEPLDPALGDRLSYHWLALGEQAPAIVWDGLRSDLPAAIAPGERATLSAALRAPEREGRYVLVWALVREGSAWLPASGDSGIAEVEVEVLPPRFAFAVESVAWPLWLPAVGVVTIEVTIRNTGAATWIAGGHDRLSYHWLEADGTTVVRREGKRTAIPLQVGPGEVVTVPLKVRGPGRGGEFVLVLDMVREHVAWFGEPPPRAGEVAARAQVRVVWSSGLWQLALIATSFVLLFIARRWRPRQPSGAVHWSWLDLMPALWCFAATWLLIVTFADLSGIALWRGARELAPATAALPALFLVLAPASWRRWLGLLWVCFVALLALADLVYLHFLGSIVPVHALTAAHQVGDIAGSVRAVLRRSYLWLVPLPVAAFGLALLWPRPQRGQGPSLGERWAARAVAFVLALAVAWSFVVEMREIMASDLGKRVFSEQRNVGRLGLVGAHIFDVARALRERSGRGEADPAELKLIEEYFAKRAKLRTEAGRRGVQTFGHSRGANLLVVQIESFQGWVVGAKVGEQEVTPFLNSLDRQGLYFPAIADVTAQGMTSDAEYALLSSAYPLAQGAISFLRADNHFFTLAHVLAQAGYATLSAHPYKRGFWNRAVLHPRYGFDRSLFARELGPGRKISWGLADEPFFRRVLPELVALPEPFFAFLVTLSVHHPYNYFPADRRRLKLGKLEGTPLGNYLHGMSEMDQAVAGLFADLEAQGLADHTLIALYGDHDARLGTPPEILKLAEMPRWTPAVPRLLERVPLFIVAPGSRADGVLRGISPRVGSLVDLAPTLLHLLGLPTPTAFIGEPLLPAADRPGASPGRARIAVYPDGSALTEGLLYVGSGRDVPAKGACFTAAGEPLPIDDCGALARAAAEALDRSRAVVDFDLARALDER